MPSIGRFLVLIQLKNVGLHLKLVKLKTLLVLKDEEEHIREYMVCFGPGTMCLLFHAR